jgi:hypothetical protein
MEMKEMLISDWLKTRIGMNTCSEAREWLSSLHAGATMADAWGICTNAQWMLWYITNAGLADDIIFRRLACAFVRRTPLADGRTVWDLLTDERTRRAVEVAEAYCGGSASASDLDAAADAAAAAAGAAAVAAGAGAVWAAARAASWAASWAEDADAARAASGAAAWAVDAAASWAEAAAEARAVQCNIIREMLAGAMK